MSKTYKAVLRISLGSVDETNGIVTGCKLADVGALAVFAGKDGKPTELRITPALVNDILGFANQAGRLDAYWTHDRLSDETRDPLHDSIGVWRNFRKDEQGNPIADLHLEPSDHKERVLWKAKNDPTGIMTSLVFGYRGGKEDARATSLESGDLVRYGAATKALLSAYPDNLSDNQPMDINELLSLLDDPAACDKILAMVKAAQKGHASADMEDADVDAAMSAAGVTDADKKPEDASKTKVTRAILTLARATQRQLSAITTDRKTLLDEAATKAEANFTAKLGKGGTFVPSEVKTENDAFEAAVQSQITAGAPNRARAIFRVQKDKPDLYAKWAKRRSEGTLAVA